MERRRPGLAVETVVVGVPVLDDAELADFERLCAELADVAKRTEARARMLYRKARAARVEFGGPMPEPPPRRKPTLRVLKKKNP